MNEKEIYEHLETLTAEQLLDIKEQITFLQADTCYCDELSLHNDDFSVCPHCGEHHVVKRGHNKNTKQQMFQCTVCKKQFTITYNTLMFSSKKPLNVF